MTLYLFLKCQIEMPAVPFLFQRRKSVFPAQEFKILHRLAVCLHNAVGGQNTLLHPADVQLCQKGLGIGSADFTVPQEQLAV